MRESTRVARLHAALRTPGQCQLGVGPMSKACVDAVIALADRHHLPLMLIASRRQIESAAQGGGYVNGWSTETFARYVREADRGECVLLCRDHGGPWQNYPEVAQRMSFPQAMASAKASLAEDIRCGFDVLHLDPSIHPFGPWGSAQAMSALDELYAFCVEEARRAGREVAIEVGGEEQSGKIQAPEALEQLLQDALAIAARHDGPKPTFVVAQTGTLVREMRNVGDFVQDSTASEALALQEGVRRLTEVARLGGVWLKEHNADYLPTPVLSRRPLLGIGAINVAPELGVAESRFLCSACESLGRLDLEDRFIELAHGTGKWEKWLVPGSHATDKEKGIMAGHYAFGMPAFSTLFQEMVQAATQRGQDLRGALCQHLEQALMRFLLALGLVNGRSPE